MADKELTRVRPSFVEKVSTQMINQLLDDILLDGIVSDGEKDSILEESNIRRDKARRLIDAVRRKGDKACRKMIAHLERRDPKLYAELGLAIGQPAPSVAEPQMEPQGATSLLPIIEKFWREKQSDKNVYQATKNAILNRVALVVTNIKFTHQELNRNGAENDEKNVVKLLTRLGYEVVKHRNLTGKAIDNAVIEFSKHPKLKDTDSVVVVIMSHGKLGAILGVNAHSEMSTADDDIFCVDNIYKHLGSEECPALVNKPKIIIIQACRGDKGGSVLVSDHVHSAVLCDDVNPPGSSPDEENIEDDTLRIVHKEKDFISLLSCTPDTVSYRQTVQGSFLIQYIVEVFNTFANNDDIEELFRKVMQRFEDLSIANKRQMPSKDRCTLTKRFYFFPGLVLTPSSH